MSRYFEGIKNAAGPMGDKKWPKKCQYNPRHIGDCKEQACNFPRCEKVSKPRPCGHHGLR